MGEKLNVWGSQSLTRLIFGKAFVVAMRNFEFISNVWFGLQTV